MLAIFASVLDWLRKRTASPLEKWFVIMRNGEIITGDGLGEESALSINDLRKVVVATDGSGPWGADVIFLLFSDGDHPAAMFPLEAQGRDAFVEWMSSQPGFAEAELAAAMSSTSVARFEVLSLVR